MIARSPVGQAAHSPEIATNSRAPRSEFGLGTPQREEGQRSTHVTRVLKTSLRIHSAVSITLLCNLRHLTLVQDAAEARESRTDITNGTLHSVEKHIIQQRRS